MLFLPGTTLSVPALMGAMMCIGVATSNSILAVIPLGTAVPVLKPDPVNGFYNVRYNGIDGWSSGKYLAPGGSTGPSSPPGTIAGGTPSAHVRHLRFRPPQRHSITNSPTYGCAICSDPAWESSNR